VYHKARQTYETLSQLLLFHGLPTPPAPDYVAVPITPVDVLVLVQHLQKGVAQLADYFELSHLPTPIKPPSEASATDVYQSLAALDSKFIALGALPPTANKVFAISQTIFDDIHTIARLKNIPPPPVAELTRNITPKESYALAYDILQDMQALLKGKNKNFVAEGIISPHTTPIQTPTPNHVLDLLVNIQAEIHDLRLGYNTPYNKSAHNESGATAGKTPQDVYQSLYMTQTLLWQLQ